MIDVPAQGVPTNAELRYSIHDQLFDVQLDDARPELIHEATSQPVPASVETWSNPILPNEQVFVVRPDTELQPQTDYRLVHFLSIPDLNSYRPMFTAAGQPQDVLNFRTGDGPDHVKPTFGGLEDISGGDRDSSGGGECSSNGYSFAEYSFRHGSDESGARVRYHALEVGTGEVLVRYASGPFSTRKCDSPLREAGNFILVRAVDLAGNIDDNLAVRKVPLEANCSCLCSLGPGAWRNFEPELPVLFLAVVLAFWRHRRSARVQAFL
jgi:hypothetical protein